jgi:nicotinamidase-related amidase
MFEEILEMTSFPLDPQSTALVLIDLQNGIAGRQLAPYTGAEVIERGKQLSTALRERGATVIFVRVSMSEFVRPTVDNPIHDPNAPPPPASASELVAGLDRQPQDLVITKRQWGAFYGTELDQQLRRRAIRTIVLGGIATNFGVESTARAAFDRGYELVFVEDAMSSVHQDAHRFATETIFPRMGRVRTTQEVLDAAR